MSGRCTLHIGANAPAMDLRALDGFLVVEDADHRSNPSRQSRTALLACCVARIPWIATCPIRLRNACRGTCHCGRDTSPTRVNSAARYGFWKAN